MKILDWLPALVICFSCSEADITLLQRNSQSSVPGSSVSLERTVSGYNIRDHHLVWVQQVPGGPLLFVAAFRTGSSDFVSSAFKGRVSGSSSGNTGQITIGGLTTADTAVYYCTRDHSD
ncbi:hypothetical protein NDU88_003865 [Pleurodeles waltl]|uniref:Ig-like domain-containing protein n=1 Tax=Pleurodeles waltl TaxID=8319 RepID=A0AAV7QD06_PLEWA|nr:hypothetical protein NDU88_003865 [Pleurodeles waltl]